MERLRPLAFYFRCSLQLALEVEAGNIAHHGADEAVILGRRLKKRIRRIWLAGLNGMASRVVKSEGRVADGLKTEG